MRLPLGIVQQQGGGGSPILVSDLFEDVNGTALNLHTPNVDVVGGGWGISTGSMTIEGNECTEDAISTVALSTIDTGEADVVITISLAGFYKNAGNVKNAGILFRYVNTSNYLWTGIWSSSTTPWTWAIAKIQSGSQTSLNTQTGVLGGNQDIERELIVTLSGDDIRFEVPVENIDMSANNAFQNTVTRHGLRLFRTSGSPIANAADILMVGN